MAFNQFDLNPLRLQNLYDNYGMGNSGDISYSGQPDYGLDTMTPFGGPMEQNQYLDPSIDERFKPTPRLTSSTPNFGTTPKNRSLFDIMDMVNNKYKPETAATERFNSLLDRFPQEGKPSLGRTLVASGMAAGQGGLENSQKFLHSPYIRDVAAWKEEAGPTYNAANLERQSNVNERTLMGNMLTASVNQERYEREAENVKFHNETNRLKAEGWSFDTKGPTIVATNPDGRVVDTGRSTGNMSDYEKLIISGNQKMDQIGATTRGALDVQNSRNAGNYATQGLRNRGNMDVQGEITNRKGMPDGSGDDEDSPAEEHRRTLNRFEYAWNNFPELRKYINVEPGGVFSTKAPPGGGIMGTSAKEKANYQKLLEIVYPQPGPSISGTPPPASGRPSAASTAVNSGMSITPIRTSPPVDINLNSARNPPVKVDITNAGKGLSPTNVQVPVAERGQPRLQAVPGELFTEGSKSNPNFQRRTVDGGKTYQYSTNGENGPWSSTPPPGWR